MTSFVDRLRLNNAYYDRYATSVVGRTQQRDYARALGSFTARLRPGGTVLDIGCGAGDHMVQFRSLGYDAVGLEPSLRMRELASAKGLSVFDGTFERLSELELPHVDGVWCAASLLHVPEQETRTVLCTIRERMAVGDPLFITVRLGTGADWDRWDAEDQDVSRFIQLYTMQALEDEITGASFSLVESWVEESTWGRPTQWLSIVAEAS